MTAKFYALTAHVMLPILLQAAECFCTIRSPLHGPTKAMRTCNIGPKIFLWILPTLLRILGIPVFLTDRTANYLTHELHFKGYSDEAIASAEEWKLFGYNRYDVTRHFERLAAQDHFIFQNAGDLIRITWNYKNMKELIDAIGQ